MVASSRAPFAHMPQDLGIPSRTRTCAAGMRETIRAMNSLLTACLAIVDGGTATLSGAGNTPATMDSDTRWGYVGVLLLLGLPLLTVGIQAVFSKTKSEIPRGLLVFGSLLGTALTIIGLIIGFRGLPDAERLSAARYIGSAAIVALGLTALHLWHVSAVRKHNPASSCQYLPDAGATTADMDNLIRRSNGRLDWLVVTGNNMVNNWLSALTHAAQNATAGQMVKVILMKEEPVLCDQMAIISGTPSSTIKQQIVDAKRKLDTIKSKYPQGIDIRQLHRIPPCTLWLAEDGNVKRVNLETLFCTDNGDGPVFRSTNQALFEKCAAEFEALWKIAT